MMYKIKRSIRDNEFLMYILSAVYRFLGFNRIKRRSGLKVHWKGVFCDHVRIINHGRDNIVELGKGCRLSHCKIQIFGNGNRIHIDHDCVGKELDIWISDGSIVEVGHNTHFSGKAHIACIEGKKVQIGERCLLSDEIVFRTGDSHSIINGGGQRINPAADIYVGKHVWIGQQVVLLKGADVGDESIIGTRSLVTGKRYERCAILAGSPAKIIKRDVTWHHDLM